MIVRSVLPLLIGPIMSVSILSCGTPWKPIPEACEKLVRFTSPKSTAHFAIQKELCMDFYSDSATFEQSMQLQCIARSNDYKEAKECWHSEDPGLHRVTKSNDYPMSVWYKNRELGVFSNEYVYTQKLKKRRASFKGKIPIQLPSRRDMKVLGADWHGAGFHAIQAKWGRIEQCAFVGGDANRLRGDVKIRMFIKLIKERPTVYKTNIAESSLNSSKVEGCLLERFKEIGFPTYFGANGGRITIVNFTVRFR